MAVALASSSQQAKDDDEEPVNMMHAFQDEAYALQSVAWLVAAASGTPSQDALRGQIHLGQILELDEFAAKCFHEQRVDPNEPRRESQRTSGCSGSPEAVGFGAKELLRPCALSEAVGLCPRTITFNL